MLRVAELCGSPIRLSGEGLLGKPRISALLATVGMASLASATMAAPLTLDDVFQTVSIDQVAPSPDGTDIAVVIQRPVGGGEVAGRSFYEIDPSRNDVWLLARDGSTRTNLTNGKAKAAAFWCAQWSPDGRHLAMLSTQPERNEPRGGNSVRLYTWDRVSGSLARLSDRAMTTHTRYGSPQNALDMRITQPGRDGPEICRRRDENAPYLWLDSHHILAMQMPEGQNSALFTQFGMPAQYAASADRALHDGQVPTVSASDTDPQRLADQRNRYAVEIAIIDVDCGARKLIARVPAFPFAGTLSAVVSPDRRSLAIMTPLAPIRPTDLPMATLNVPDAAVQKRLGLVALDGKTPIRWIEMPASARFPLDLLDWSPDSNRLMLRARADATARTAEVLTLNARTGQIAPAAPAVVSYAGDAGADPHPSAARWTSDQNILIRGKKLGQSDAAPHWWRVERGGAPILLEKPATDTPPSDLPPDAELLASDRRGIIWHEQTPRGEFLRETLAGKSAPVDLLALNTHLGQVDWGKVLTIDYTAEDHTPVKGLVIQPPDYDPSRRYPLLVWVYPGTVIHGVTDYWSDPYLPGIYNLQLYAARGYIVLVPSMPMRKEAGPNGPYDQMTNGVLPAIDKLVSLGMVDERRVGLFGQSYGGYATYALVTQTDRFAAAVAIAGSSDLAAEYEDFDRGGEGWIGFAQGKSASAQVLESGLKFHANPVDQPEFYRANSPITYVSRVHTPLLLAHGTLDGRAGIGEAQRFFSALYRQGKPARLLSYYGENHALDLSPANVRDLYEEMLSWFDNYLKPR